MAFREMLHGVVDLLGRQPQRAQSFQNLNRAPPAHLDHSASHRGVIEVAFGVDLKVAMGQSNVRPQIRLPHSEAPHYTQLGGRVNGLDERRSGKSPSPNRWRAKRVGIGKRTMNIALWVLQVLLSLAFVFHANLMLRPSPERLQSGMKYVLEMPARLRLFAGITEGLAGLALVFCAVDPRAGLAHAAGGGRPRPACVRR